MRLPFIVHETAGLNRRGEVLVGGVPVGRGELTDGGWFIAKADGAEAHVLEGTPAAWWPDGSVKWLHLCGAVNLPAGRATRFELTESDHTPEASMSVEHDGRAIRIRGGAIDVDASSDHGAILAVRRPDGTPLIDGPGLSSSLWLTGPELGERRKLNWQPDADGPRVVVQTGNRVVLRLGGTYGDGERPESELIIFVEVLRESAELRIEPVFIYLGRPNEDLVAGLTLTAHTTARGDTCRYGFGNDRGKGWWDITQRIEDGPRWPTARQLQLGSSYYRTEKRVCPEGSWVKAVEGDHSPGWCHLAHDDVGVTAAMRYFWQEYPHELAVDADRGEITFGLRPPDGPPIDFRRYSPIVYGAAVYEYKPKNLENDRFPVETHGAAGVAKAHELLLRFDDPAGAQAAEHGLRWASPCRPMPDPEHFAGTEVIGKVPPLTTEGATATAEDKIAEATDFLVNERHVRRWYGLLDWGDVMIAYYSDRDSWAFDDGGYAWLNTESLPDYGLWISALRSARPDWLAAAIEMTRHNRDLDTYHRGQFHGSGTRHNVNHWGCADKEWRVSMPLVRRLHYYLTADPWTAEVIRHTVAMYQSYDRTSSVAPSMTAAVAGVLAKSEMTGDPEDLQTLRNLADIYSNAVRDDGFWTSQIHADLATGKGEPVGDQPYMSHFFMNSFGGQHTLLEVAEVLEHRALSDAIIRYTEHFIEYDGSHGGNGAIMPFLAHAWRQTGNDTFLGVIREALDQERAAFGEIGGGDDPLDEPRRKVLLDMQRKNKIACGLGQMMHTIPYGLRALREANSA